MKYSIKSSDHTSLAYETSGRGDTALLFVHGWLGNKDWWSVQRDFFFKDYVVVAMDLAGHGESGKEREHYTAELYADDIASVANSLKVKEVILVAHSMSGGYALIAAHKIKNLKAMILVDTLKNLDMKFTPEQVSKLLTMYRQNFKGTVHDFLPKHLFNEKTPEKIKERLNDEFMQYSPEFAACAVEPLYQLDLKSLTRNVNVPVRGIFTDVSTIKSDNGKHFKDYAYKLIPGLGHYPMLEDPVAFNKALKEILDELGVGSVKRSRRFSPAPEVR